MTTAIESRTDEHHSALKRLRLAPQSLPARSNLKLGWFSWSSSRKPEGEHGKMRTARLHI